MFTLFWIKNLLLVAVWFTWYFISLRQNIVIIFSDVIDKPLGANSAQMSWKAYHRHSTINTYLDYLGQIYPNICSVFTIGFTNGIRPMKLLKISNGHTGNPAIWIDGGMQARDWITISSVTYLIDKLAQNWTNLPQYMRNIDWHILPVSNPDGYEYTHTNDRYWRKNRNVEETCIGVDLNRNFGLDWGKEGVSLDPCDVQYCGSNAFSEYESKAIRNYLSNKQNFKAYLTFQHYGHYILYPWGNNRTVPSDYMDLDSLAKRAAEKIQNISGASYVVGPSAILQYPISGSSADWARGTLGIKFVYTVQLGKYTFILPENETEITGQEVIAIAATTAETVSKLYSKN